MRPGTPDNPTVSITIRANPSVSAAPSARPFSALHAAGHPMSAAEIAARVWGPEVGEVTVRAQLSRLRTRFPHLVSVAP